MGKVYDINPSELIIKASVELKKTNSIKKPDWAAIVKTGPGQERQPADPDWWYMRAASVLRKIYVRGPIGVSKLRVFYGTKKNRGAKPEKFYKGSGKIIRVVLQQLEAEGLVRQTEKGVHKGRVVTPKGQSLLDNISKQNGTGGNKKAEVAKAPTGGDANADATADAGATATEPTGDSN